MDIFSIRQSLRTDIWKILPNDAKVLETKLNMLIKGISLPTKEVSQDIGSSDLTVINLNGQILKRVGYPRDMLEFVGIQDLDYLDEDIQSAIETPTPTTIINISSGGGSILGLEETGHLLNELDSKTNLIAYTDTYCCSAAYEIASHCNTIISSPSAMVGMVGTYFQRFDISKLLEASGITVNTFGEGDYKTMYLEEVPLTDKQKALFVEQIKEANSAFQSQVMSKRDIALEDLQGQIFNGNVALTKGLVDANINSFTELLKAI